MGKHRHPVTNQQRAATFGRRLVSGLCRAAVCAAVVIFWGAIILGFLALFCAAVLYGLEGR